MNLLLESPVQSALVNCDNYLYDLHRGDAAYRDWASRNWQRLSAMRLYVMTRAQGKREAVDRRLTGKFLALIQDDLYDTFSENTATEAWLRFADVADMVGDYFWKAS